MNNCIVCGAPLMKDALLLCENMPSSAQDIPDAEQVKEDSGIELRLCQCSGCGLVQFDCEPVPYYRDVIRAGGFSTTMVELRRAQYAHLIEEYKLEGKRFIEVGCGRGEFLKVLTEFPVQAYGMENNKALVQIAQNSGLNVREGFTETEGTLFENAPFDVFLSFNFLEHQPNPNTMLRCIYNNLTDNGYGLITVPSFEYILKNNGFYELLHDHIANYTKESLHFVLEKNGFQVLESTIINKDTLSVIVKKKQRFNVDSLKNNLDLLSKQMQEFVNIRIVQNKKVAVWGASHQGFTAIPTTGVSKDISYIIDSAPFKQGKFAPASHVKIVSPEYYFVEPVDTIIIIAPGYTNEIAQIINNKYGGNVEIAALKSDSLELL